MPILSDEDVRTDFGTGLMMVCTFGDGADVQRWKRDGLDLRLGIDPGRQAHRCRRRVRGARHRHARASGSSPTSKPPARSRGSQKIEQQVSVSERTQRPVEFQMRPHWFVRVLDLTDELLARSAELAWHPEYMKVRLDHWIEGLKYDWNITRQRFYGVPFPVWYCDGVRRGGARDRGPAPRRPAREPAARRRVREVRRAPRSRATPTSWTRG